MKTAHEILKKYFGYDKFRPLQEEIVNRTVEGGDSLVLMPTGGGKSICFQVPALMLDGCALVISPLISLMKDQVETLQMNGISAAALNSAKSSSENRMIKTQVANGTLKLLYISPERLLLEIEWFSQQKISMIAIDEAHCISQWGHDFRPEYTQLSALRKHFENVPIIALTATADKLTQNDILEQLHLKNPQKFVSSFDRPNLSLDVKIGLRKRDKIAAILDVINRHNGDSGIIYCLSRKLTEDVAEELRKCGINAKAYHAQIESTERSRVQEDFINDKIQVVCATVAFGMGIDKSNVRFVIHYNLPKSIESFYQEIGRAGRDSLESETLLFYNLADIIMLQKFVEGSSQLEINQEKLDRMKEYAEATVCRRRILLNYFGETSDKNCGNCDVCKNPPKLFDGTIIVQKALSAIARTKEQIGFTLLLDILRGSMNFDITNLGYEKIKTFGVGRDIRPKDWQNYFLQMLQMGFIEIAYNENSHLKITTLGHEVLKGKPVQLAQVEIRDFKAKKQKMIRSEAPTIAPNNDLFQVLKELRRQIAKELNKPAFVIFSDKTLHAIADTAPTSREEFKEIWGVGENKTALFADKFINAIKNYLRM